MDAVDVWQRKRRSDARYASREQQRNAVRAIQRTRPRNFIGVDGEGITLPDGTHQYVLLSVGTESLHNGGEPITIDQILPFLWEQFELYQDSIFAGFYLGYDFTEWFKGLPENRARMLLTETGAAKRFRKKGKNPVPFPVYYNDWEMDLHAGKRFKLRPRGNSGPWLYICDTGPFFQTSFLNVINPKNWPEPICSPEEYATILEGKQNRSNAEFDYAMIRYNTLENEVLARVLHELDKGFTQMGVRLKKSQWYGPGQAAQVWLNNIKAPTKDDAKYNIPEHVLEAARSSYYGGWFEIMAHGHIPGHVYEYDINSAYPTVIANLPCFLHGNWRQTKTPDPDALALVFIEVWQNDSTRRIGTMPHRTSKGAILRPRHTRGWHHWQEVQAAIRAGAIDGYRIEAGYQWVPGCTEKPFKAIAGLYTQRQEVGKDTPLGKALKLVYNSSYGKLAQSIGEPRYANPIYASMIVSGCRQMIWDAIATHPIGINDVTMVATDGIYFRSPHPTLPISNRLGDWDTSDKLNLCQFMPGLYWDDKSRNGAVLKSRGISGNDLRAVLPTLDARWNVKRRILNGEKPSKHFARAVGGKDKAAALIGMWPTLSVPVSFGLISAKLALHRNAWHTAGTIDPKPRLLSGDPSDKRDPFSAVVIDDVIWTMPYAMGPDGLDSTPYEKRFGLELRVKQLDDDIITPDGHIDDEIYELTRER